MEEKKEVKVFQTNMKCDKCHEGNMIFDNVTYTLGILKTHIHTCDKCKANNKFEVKYPIIEYKSISE